jgi:hypothetical protein
MRLARTLSILGLVAVLGAAVPVASAAPLDSPVHNYSAADYRALG